MQARVLVIEDELSLAELIAMYLEKAGIEVAIAYSAEEAEGLLARESVDLITLDINLPGKDGFEFLLHLRKTQQVPVMIVSAREADEDVILGLGIGADEFVSKPFAPRVLVARVRAMLRRAQQQQEERRGERAAAQHSFLDYSLDSEALLLKRGSERIHLSSKECAVLTCLIERAGEALSSEDLYESVWGNSYGDLSAVAVYIQRLRKKLEADPKQPTIIETVFGKGYRFNRDLLT